MSEYIYQPIGWHWQRDRNGCTTIGIAERLEHCYGFGEHPALWLGDKGREPKTGAFLKIQRDNTFVADSLPNNTTKERMLDCALDPVSCCEFVRYAAPGYIHIIAPCVWIGNDQVSHKTLTGGQLHPELVTAWIEYLKTISPVFKQNIEYLDTSLTQPRLALVVGNRLEHYVLMCLYRLLWRAPEIVPGMLKAVHLHGMSINKVMLVGAALSGCVVNEDKHKEKHAYPYFPYIGACIGLRGDTSLLHEAMDLGKEHDCLSAAYYCLREINYTQIVLWDTIVHACGIHSGWIHNHPDTFIKFWDSYGDKIVTELLAINSAWRHFKP